MHVEGKEREREVKIAKNKKLKALRDYSVQSTSADTFCVIKLTIQANNFVLRTGIIQLV